MCALVMPTFVIECLDTFYLRLHSTQPVQSLMLLTWNEVTCNPTCTLYSIHSLLFDIHVHCTCTVHVVINQSAYTEGYSSVSVTTQSLKIQNNAVSFTPPSKHIHV